MAKPNQSSLVYFAAEEDSKRLVERTFQRVTAYREWFQRSGRQARALRAWSAYYGSGPDGAKDSSAILALGEAGEVQAVTANLYGVVVRQVMRLLTGQKPAFKTVAETSDSDAMAQAMLGDALLESYDRKLRVSEAESDSVLCGLLAGSGFVASTWATDAGEEIGIHPDLDKVLYEGDVKQTVLTPWDVAYDVQASPEDRDWVCFRVRAKRHNLAARFPDRAHEIITASDEDSSVIGPDGQPTRWADRPTADVASEDTVWLWELRHLPTPACPNGRLVRFLNSKVVLYDSAKVKAAPAVPEVEEEEGRIEIEVETQETDAGYPYPGLLVEEYCPERRVGFRADSHSALWDTLSLQEGLDMVATALTTNANVGALVNLWVGPGDSPAVESLATGLNLVKSATKPEKLDMLDLPQELVGLSSLFKDWMQQIAGLNEVVMGNTPSGMPAQLAALLEAKAVQYHQAGQANYYRLVEGNRTNILKLLQRFAEADRVSSIAGKAGNWMVKSWKAADIKSLERVAVEPVNPIMRTFAFRVELAEKLAERYGISLDEYLSVYFTGALHEVTDARKARLGRIQRNKELLMQGIGLPPIDMVATQQALMLDPTAPPVFSAGEPGQTYVRLLVTDKHWADVPEYLSVLESPEAREDQAVAAAVLGVVQESLRLWATMPPQLQLLLGAPMPGAMPPGMPGGPADGAPPAGVEGGPTMAGDMPSADVGLPSPPPNPTTGEEAPPPVMPAPAA